MKNFLGRCGIEMMSVLLFSHLLNFPEPKNLALRMGVLTKAEFSALLRLWRVCVRTHRKTTLRDKASESQIFLNSIQASCEDLEEIDGLVGFSEFWRNA